MAWLEGSTDVSQSLSLAMTMLLVLYSDLSPKYRLGKIHLRCTGSPTGHLLLMRDTRQKPQQ